MGAAYFLRVKAGCSSSEWLHYTCWHMSAWDVGRREREREEGVVQVLRLVQDIQSCCPWVFWLWANGIVWHATTAWRWVMKWRACVPLCLSPLWRLKGDRCLDTVPRLNDWNGMEEGTKSTYSRSPALPRRRELPPWAPQRKRCVSGLRYQWKRLSRAIFLARQRNANSVKEQKWPQIFQFPLSALLIMLNSTKLKDESHRDVKWEEM